MCDREELCRCVFYTLGSSYTHSCRGCLLSPMGTCWEHAYRASSTWPERPVHMWAPAHTCPHSWNPPTEAYTQLGLPQGAIGALAPAHKLWVHTPGSTQHFLGRAHRAPGSAVAAAWMEENTLAPSGLCLGHLKFLATFSRHNPRGQPSHICPPDG